MNIPGTWQGVGIQYLPYYSFATCRENLVTTQTSAGLKVTSVEGAKLTQADLKSVKISAMMMADGSETDTTKGYRSSVSSDGKTALFTLVEPTVGTAAEAEATTDPDDPSGQLVEVPESQVAAKPAVKVGEELGALPAKAVKGLWYQASWGTDLGNMTQGAKVQATGDTLYLGVIKQTGTSGFYRVSVTEQ